MTMWALAAIALSSPFHVATVRDLDTLVSGLRKQGLPMPPPIAPLVYVDGRLREGEDSPGQVHKVGYLLTQRSGKARVLMGTITETVDAQDCSPVSMTRAGAKTIDLTATHRVCGEAAALPIAAAERMRGHTEFALAVLDRFLAENPYEQLITRQNISDMAGFLALYRWINLSVDPNADRREVLRNLVLLRRSHPDLFNEPENKLVESLRATIRGRYRGNDPMERRIDALCNSESSGDNYELVSLRFNRNREELWNRRGTVPDLVRLGFAAIPALLRHADDKRLTRAVPNHWFGNFVEFPVTVGDISLNIAEQFLSIPPTFLPYAGRAEKTRRWWKVASRRTVRETYMSAIRELETPIVPIAWAVRNAPELLLEGYDSILGKPGQTFTMLDAMRDSTLPKATVIEAAKRGLRSSNRDQVHASLWALEKLDRDEFDAGLLVALPSIPRNVDSEDRLFREASFAQVASYSESEEVWRALTKVTRRAVSGLRLQLLRESTYSEKNENGRRRYLGFLLAFFDDKDVANLAFPYSDHDGMSVQNGAAVLAARVLKLSEPEDKASRDEWALFRASVRKRVEDYPKT